MKYGVGTMPCVIMCNCPILQIYILQFIRRGYRVEIETWNADCQSGVRSIIKDWGSCRSGSWGTSLRSNEIDHLQDREGPNIHQLLANYRVQATPPWSSIILGRDISEILASNESIMLGNYSPQIHLTLVITSRASFLTSDWSDRVVRTSDWLQSTDCKT